MSLSFQSKRAPSIAAFEPAWWKIALAVYIALLLQTTLVARLDLRGGRLSLVLLVLLWFARHAGVRRALRFGAIVGICEDALASTGIAWTIADGAIGAMTAALARTPVGDSLLLAAPTVALLTVARYAVFVTTLSLERRSASITPLHWHAVLWQGVYNGGVALLALVLAQRFELPYGERDGH
jgi:cell shape-determining protein MreD